MRKGYYVIFDTAQSDSQCRLELEHAIGELTQNRAVMIEPMNDITINQTLENYKKRRG